MTLSTEVEIILVQPFSLTVCSQGGCAAGRPLLPALTWPRTTWTISRLPPQLPAVPPPCSGRVWRSQMHAEGGELGCWAACWQSTPFFPTCHGQHHQELIPASLCRWQQLHVDLLLAGWETQEAQWRPLSGNKPRRRTINILLLSSLFPRAFPSTFLTPFGTFVLLRWCHLPKLSPWSFSSWSAGKMAESGHACLHFVLCPDTPAGIGCPSHPAHATLLPLGILGSEFFSLYLYLDQAFNSTTTGSEHFQIKLWFQFPIPIYSVLELAEQSYTYVLLWCVHRMRVSQPQLTC